MNNLELNNAHLLELDENSMNEINGGVSVADAIFAAGMFICQAFYDIGKADGAALRRS